MAEKYRKYIYCDINFIREVLYPDSESVYTVESIASGELVKAIRNLIFSPYIVLFINATHAEFNDILKSINKKRLKAAKKGENIVLTPFECAIMEIDMASQEAQLQLKYTEAKNIDEILGLAKHDSKWHDAIILDNKDLTATDIDKCEAYGMMVICKESWKKCQSLLGDNGQAIKKGNMVNWKDCINISRIPCNSVVIIDNYALNETKNFDNNIKPILDTLLPIQLDNNIVLQLAFFVFLAQNKGNKLEHLYPEKRIEKLNNILAEIRPQLKYSLTIYKCNKESFHDRCIITNNLLINCGAGFDLIHDHRASKHTTISVLHPFLSVHSSWAAEAVSNIIGEIRNIGRTVTSEYGKNNVNFCFPTFSIGPKDLRIFNE